VALLQRDKDLGEKIRLRTEAPDVSMVLLDKEKDPERGLFFMGRFHPLIPPEGQLTRASCGLVPKGSLV